MAKFQKGNRANPKGRGSVPGRATVLAREFASSIVDRADVQKKTLDMWLAGELPPATMNLLLMYRYGRPKVVVEVTPPPQASRKELLRQLTPDERRQLNVLNMAMLTRAPRIIDAVPQKALVPKTETEPKDETNGAA